MKDDAQLLLRYARDREEEAFAELVRRHLGFVYASALRQVNGDAHLAADVAQLVFVDLARKAGRLAGRCVLAGWLFTSTRYAAAKLVRSEQRRRAREREARIVNEPASADFLPLDQDKLRRWLDDALASLSAADRDAVLLRYFEGRPFAEIGARLSLNENAARMRVERALERLRSALTRRGLASTSAALATALGAQASVPAPAMLAGVVTHAALTGGSTGVLTGILMSMTKLQTAAVGVIALAGGAGYYVQADAKSELTTELSLLRGSVSGLPGLRDRHEMLIGETREFEELRRDDAEFARLRTEAKALRERMQLPEQGSPGSVPANSAEPVRDVFPAAALDMAPVPRFQARPVYPFGLRRAGIDGEVVVGLVIDHEGVPREVQARSSKITFNGKVLTTGEVTEHGITLTALMREELEMAAVQAVEKWRFRAGRKDGRDVNTLVAVPIVFSSPGEKPSEARAKEIEREARWF